MKHNDADLKRLATLIKHPIAYDALVSIIDAELANATKLTTDYARSATFNPDVRSTALLWAGKEQTLTEIKKLLASLKEV